VATGSATISAALSPASPGTATMTAYTIAPAPPTGLTGAVTISGPASIQ
jgi:hypothetical protein